ncbi:MAG: methyl-accepting chemotaxis protein [Oscillospiraceae bacterium]|nr:methyl-accepting chemotaxis protein [Oscillospiraceae bacterium]
MKSIGTKIIVASIALVGISLLTLGIVSCVLMYTSAKELSSTDMHSIVFSASKRVRWQLESYTNIAEDLGTIPKLADPNASDDDKQAVLNSTASMHDGVTRCGLVYANGIGLDGNDYSDYEFFKTAIRGEVGVCEPTVSPVTGKVSMAASAPLWENGVYNSTIIGVTYIIPDEEFLNDIVRNISISENSIAYMIDNDGDTIAAIDTDTIVNGENIEALALTNKGYEGVAKIHEKMRNGEDGFWRGNYNGQTSFMAYYPIDGTNGWVLAAYAPVTDFMSDSYTAIYTTVIVIIASLVIAVLVAIKLGTSIGRPIRLCAERIELLSDGDLTSPLPAVKSKDETAILARATNTVVGKLNGMIKDMGRILGSMADGDLSVSTAEGKSYYTGDFEQLRTFAHNINVKLSDTMVNINDAGDQVASSSDQVSIGAQSLSQGATEQASSIEELAAEIHMISDQVTLNSENCATAKSLVNETTEYVNNANTEMERLTEAMNDINDTSDKISNIIKTIDDIAFQTNILALNAAVEAARAGEAGKGFAVVADEVRNLASKSADAAKDTAALIQQSITAVQHGTQIATSTASAMQSVGERTISVEEIVEKIAEASEHQADMIVQISTGVEQISGVVQNNSATAEESAAASEELSSQATMLKNLIGSFRLRK